MDNLFFPTRSAYSPRPILRPAPTQTAPKSMIQKIFRGFLARKNMQKVKKIAAEAVEIGHQISAIKIRDDDKERLRISEMFVALLLRLDAVRGVREYRKKVIRQVIQLQEAIDSIAQGDTLNSDESKAMDDMVIPAGDVDGDNDDDYRIAAEEIEEVEPQKEDSMIEKVLKQGDEEIDGESWGIEESIEAPAMADLTPVGGEEMIKRIKDAMEKASAETEAWIRMLGELCERSAQQCELMSGLVQRVDQLERRLQRMERKKKKQ